MIVRSRQLRGDPAIRQFLFAQTRTESPFDRRCDRLMDRIEELFLSFGAFHVQLDMSTCQMILWSLDDPFNYQVFVGDEVFDQGRWGQGEYMAYPDSARIRPDEIRPILTRFRSLRLADDRVYLRSGSLNIMNGMVRLHFSCDGTHYVDHREFMTSSLYDV